ncbi:MAG: UDP-glucose/GDP-mannose dehydrogenase family protein [Gammaproteobacteria bacterium]|nr:UDP-glucose/GDP-mannose dehydrogenase family protein [Gammaproteobacteria bacterium]
MKVTVFGTGYVGLVTGICLADLGNDVICVDIDHAKVAQLQQGVAPIFEPGLERMLQDNLSMERIKFTTDFEMGAKHGLFQFIAVGTPSNDDGAADLRAVHDVADKIGKMMQSYCLIITKSTVPVGTADEVREIISRSLATRNVSIDFDIASNPEFLREGAAISDFMNPDRIIVGADNVRALDYLRELYMPLIDLGKRFVVMDTRSSELTKYASNAFLATKISFMNEMSHLAEKLGADIEHVRVGMSMDPRIGEHFLFPGCGYGGSCFPKDVQALTRTAKDFGQELRILSATEAVNQDQKYILVNKLHKFFKDGLQDKTIALWGLSFKPNTDDMREASSKIVIENLLSLGAKIQAYDPVAMEEARKLYGSHPAFSLGETHETVLANADVLVIVTEWDIFRSPNFNLIKESLRHPAIFDGRNLYEPLRLSSLGLHYFAVGRGHKI